MRDYLPVLSRRVDDWPIFPLGDLHLPALRQGIDEIDEGIFASREWLLMLTVSDGAVALFRADKREQRIVPLSSGTKKFE
jgi:hypothetical protein